MFTKLKVVLITGAIALAGIGGVAAAQGKGGGGARRAERKARMLEKFDTNTNGVLDPAEKQAMFDQRAAKRFEKLDTNNDGALSLEEFKAGKQKLGRQGRGTFRGGKLGRGGKWGGGPDRP
jgi:hypothetical protein